MFDRLIGWLRPSRRPGDDLRATAGLEVTESSYMGTPFFVLRGELDQSEARRLADLIRSGLPPNHPHVILGLSGLEYVGSGGLYLFIDLAGDLEGVGWLGVINPNANLRRMFDVVGLSHVDGFRIFDSSEEAFAALRDRAKKRT